MSEPLHENKLHVLWLKQLRVSPWPGIHNRCMKDAHYLTKPVGECLPRVHVIMIFMRQSHEVSMHSWIQRILGMAEIICHVIHMKGIVFVNVIVYEYQSIVLLCCK